jgi:hypothetical protein
MVRSPRRSLEDVPAEVRREQERLARWRANKGTGPEPIPEKHWEAAVTLSRTHGVSRVSRWLRLHHTALKERLGRISTRRSVRPQPRFVEWRPPAGGLPGSSAAEYVVEVASAEDAAPRIHVRGASVAEVAALARALRGAGSAG